MYNSYSIMLLCTSHAGYRFPFAYISPKRGTGVLQYKHFRLLVVLCGKLKKKKGFDVGQISPIMRFCYFKPDSYIISSIRLCLPPCHCCCPGDRRTLFSRSKICCRFWYKSSARWHLQTLPASWKVRSYSSILFQLSSIACQILYLNPG